MLRAWHFFAAENARWKAFSSPSQCTMLTTIVSFIWKVCILSNDLEIIHSKTTHNAQFSKIIQLTNEGKQRNKKIVSYTRDIHLGREREKKRQTWRLYLETDWTKLTCNYLYMYLYIVYIKTNPEPEGKKKNNQRHNTIQKVGEMTWKWIILCCVLLTNGRFYTKKRKKRFMMQIETSVPIW